MTRPDYRPPAGHRRLRLTVAWDGAPFAGWQSQPALPSVQDALHGALARLGGGEFRPVAAGRTDAGVHAETMPVHMDVPEIDVIWTDIPDPHTPMGAHGIGEIGITGVAAAVANAVYNATGKRVRDLPITLDKLL